MSIRVGDRCPSPRKKLLVDVASKLVPPRFRLVVDCIRFGCVEWRLGSSQRNTGILRAEIRRFVPFAASAVRSHDDMPR